jgi:hypothetical protein
MRQNKGIQRAAAVLLQATIVVGFLSGCGVATRPADDGALDLPHFASQAPSKGDGTFSPVERLRGGGSSDL